MQVPERSVYSKSSHFLGFERLRTCVSIELMMDYNGEIRRLRVSYAALEQEPTDCKNALKEEKQKHRKLRAPRYSLPAEARPTLQEYRSPLSRILRMH
ncbi:hypothetical protein OSTOST_04055 [Ostertagia ostertagi]